MSGPGGPQWVPMRPQVVAHRGASHDTAEHTLGAYLRALDEGADALECDVRLTADGHLVCVHDRDLRRTAAHTRHRVDDAPGRARPSSTSPSWKNPWADLDDEAPDVDAEHGRVLTLRKLLETVADYDRRVEVAIETKHPTRYGGLVERRLAEMLREFGWHRTGSPVRVMSFSYTALQRMQKLAPELPLVMLFEKKRGLADAAARWSADGWILGPGIELLEEHPKLARRLARTEHDLHVWTVNTQAQLELCLDLGVKAVITDRPGFMLQPARPVGSPAWESAHAPRPVTTPPRPVASGLASRAPAAPGRRYKACHGAARRGGRPPSWVARSPGCRPSATSIALRELVPAASAPLTLKDSDRARPAVLAAARGGPGDGPRLR